MRIVVFCAVFFLLPAWAWAEYVVCGTGSQLARAYFSDPSQVTDPSCVVIPKAETAAQVALVEGNPPKYVKVTGAGAARRAAVKTQAEKDAIDTTLTAAAATQQAARDELTANDACATATLADIHALLLARRATVQTQVDTAKANLQAQIDGLANVTVASMKAALTAVNNAVFTTVAGNVLDETYILVEKGMKCTFARAKAR